MSGGELMQSRLQQTATLVCDENGCAWTLEIPWENMPHWHNKACPACGEGVVINDDDLAAWHVASAMIHMTNAIDPEGKLPRVKVHIDTAPLRKTRNGE